MQGCGKQSGQNQCQQPCNEQGSFEDGPKSVCVKTVQSGLGEQLDEHPSDPGQSDESRDRLDGKRKRVAAPVGVPQLPVTAVQQGWEQLLGFHRVEALPHAPYADSAHADALDLTLRYGCVSTFVVISATTDS